VSRTRIWSGRAVRVKATPSSLPPVRPPAVSQPSGIEPFAYAPDLNPVEGLWSVLRRTSLANRAFTDPDDLVTTVRTGLRQLQYRPDVLDGCLAGTGLNPVPP
jgi:hypothetical protein